MAWALAESPTYYLFSHGIADTQKQAHNYLKSYVDQTGKPQETTNWIMQDPVHLFNYPDATEGFWRINFWHTSLGQSNEIDALYAAYCTLKERIQTEQIISYRIVLVGVSRGASTIINFLAEYQPQDIDAVILESPFASTSDIIQQKTSQMKLDGIVQTDNFGQKLLSTIFPQYTPWALQPIESIRNIPKHIPILFIACKTDRLVPYESTQKLYDALKAQQNFNVYMHTFDDGVHARLIMNESGEEYMKIVHKFYQKYDLPHDSSVII